ncbi:nuclear GTPase SLIP-GC-like isoform X2 [Trematomus bernacchii]|uniref:nuclear GTPase SLIP-GC-like isoform X2 n=1 Tax=Trematomus bernacchii TaxID=40690 RepID=UPI00146CC3CB|nr:nuclear GTPase SLIP-GC-like isoform X2 [Trematomus bernacchii]
MDDFVGKKLSKWSLSELTQTCEDHEVDKESLYCLEDRDIADLIPKVGPRSKFRKRLKLLKEEQSTKDPETSDSSVEVYPSTSKTNDKGKRKLGLPGESSQSPARKRPRKDIQGSNKEEEILSDVKNIMSRVLDKLPNKYDKFNTFLKERERKNINTLETDKRELVGVFGKTGAGKSSLINAVIGVKDLLPSGSISACTSVMIKVEANMKNPKYEAEIEFITKEEWKEELRTLINFARDNKDQENYDDDQDSVETLSLLYGEEWKNKTPENLMDKKYFREIPEFLSSKSKILTRDTAEDLSSELVKYTQSKSKEEDAKWYRPLVKCVTVRVPNNPFLQHVTLVDLPGNGDRNKSRDTMWKKVIGSCSTVWIVTDINRAASEKEPWEILKESCSLMGNGGECWQIHFICTKSDHCEDSDDHSAAGVHAQILKQNKQAKIDVRAEFNKLKYVKKQFSDEDFKVFTVSSKEFLRKKRLDPDETEIPELQKILQALNDSHSETLNYVSGARGILFLIQGVSSREGADIKKNVCKGLEKELICELHEVRETMNATRKAFEKCLSEGVEKSKSSCDEVLKSVLYPEDSGSAFHRTLKCVVEKGGIHKPKNGELININMKLTSYLTDSIDEEFKKTFPNEGNSGPFKGVINAFSLGTEKKLKNKKYGNVKCMLTFLRTVEEKMKTNLNKIIRDRKKTIYSSLTTTIEEIMQPCYDKAKIFKGEGSMNKMRETIEKHVCRSKDVMFAQAKDAMMTQLRYLMLEIPEKLESTMKESIVLSLKTYGVSQSLPDVSEELGKVNNYYKELKRKTVNPDDDATLRDSPGQAAAVRP